MTEKQDAARQHNWIRRCLMGARWPLERVATLPTASDEARELARKIDIEIRHLVWLLRDRDAKD